MRHHLCIWSPQGWATHSAHCIARMQQTCWRLHARACAASMGNHCLRRSHAVNRCPAASGMLDSLCLRQFINLLLVQALMFALLHFLDTLLPEQIPKSHTRQPAEQESCQGAVFCERADAERSTLLVHGGSPRPLLRLCQVGQRHGRPPVPQRPLQVLLSCTTHALCRVYTKPFYWIMGFVRRTLPTLSQTFSPCQCCQPGMHGVH